MNKYVKFSIAGAIIIFITIAAIVYINSYSPKVLKASENAFSIIDGAFKEERELTEAEELELEGFLEMRDIAMDKFEELKWKDEQDAVLLLAVGDLYDKYLVDMEAFKTRYNEVKILLE